MVEFFERVDWTAVAAMAAAASAAFAGYQIRQTTRWNQLDRTFSHSPYKSEVFQSSQSEIDKAFSGWQSSETEPSNCEIQRTLSNEECRTEFLVMLNHWGRMASELDAGLLDQKKARELYALNFSRFCCHFYGYINHPTNSRTYAHTLKLIDRWDSRSIRKQACLGKSS